MSGQDSNINSILNAILAVNRGRAPPNNIAILNLIKQPEPNPVDTGRKLNAHKTLRRRPGRLLNVLCTFKLRPVSTGKALNLAIIW